MCGVGHDGRDWCMPAKVSGAQGWVTNTGDTSTSPALTLRLSLQDSCRQRLRDTHAKINQAALLQRINHSNRKTGPDNTPRIHASGPVL